MVLPTLAQRLRAGSTVLSSWSCIPEALTVEAISRLGFEAITLDMQHGGHSDDSVIRSLGAIDRRVCHPVVRIPVGRFDMASRALDFGAEAVIAPMINNVEDARAFAKATKYPPLGQRSWGPVFAMPRAGASDGQEWLKQQNHETIAYAMIETREAYEAVDDILAVDGIDGVFVGPADFSIAWSAGSEARSFTERHDGSDRADCSQGRQGGQARSSLLSRPARSGALSQDGLPLLRPWQRLRLSGQGGGKLHRDRSWQHPLMLHGLSRIRAGEAFLKMRQKLGEGHGAFRPRAEARLRIDMAGFARIHEKRTPCRCDVFRRFIA